MRARIFIRVLRARRVRRTGKVGVEENINFMRQPVCHLIKSQLKMMPGYMSILRSEEGVMGMNAIAIGEEDGASLLRIR